MGKGGAVPGGARPWRRRRAELCPSRPAAAGTGREVGASPRGPGAATAAAAAPPLPLWAAPGAACPRFTDTGWNYSIIWAAFTPLFTSTPENGRREEVSPAAELPPSASDTSLSHLGSLMQNSRNKFSGKHGSTIIPPTPLHLLSLCRDFPDWQMESILFHEDHHTVALGRVLGAWTLEKMPTGKGLPCLAPETAILSDTSKVWEVPPAPALCLPQLAPPAQEASD